jgi:hypothetical protein
VCLAGTPQSEFNRAQAAKRRHHPGSPPLSPSPWAPVPPWSLTPSGQLAAGGGDSGAVTASGASVTCTTSPFSTASTQDPHTAHSSAATMGVLQGAADRLAHMPVAAPLHGAPASDPAGATSGLPFGHLTFGPSPSGAFGLSLYIPAELEEAELARALAEYQASQDRLRLQRLGSSSGGGGRVGKVKSAKFIAASAQLVAGWLRSIRGRAGTPISGAPAGPIPAVFDIEQPAAAAAGQLSSGGSSGVPSLRELVQMPSSSRRMRYHPAGYEMFVNPIGAETAIPAQESDHPLPATELQAADSNNASVRGTTMTAQQAAHMARRHRRRRHGPRGRALRNALLSGHTDSSALGRISERPEEDWEEGEEGGDGSDGGAKAHEGGDDVVAGSGDQSRWGSGSGPGSGIPGLEELGALSSTVVAPAQGAPQQLQQQSPVHQQYAKQQEGGSYFTSQPQQPQPLQPAKSASPLVSRTSSLVGPSQLTGSTGVSGAVSQSSTPELPIGDLTEQHSSEGEDAAMLGARTSSSSSSAALNTATSSSTPQLASASQQQPHIHHQRLDSSGSAPAPSPGRPFSQALQRIKTSMMWGTSSSTPGAAGGNGSTGGASDSAKSSTNGGVAGGASSSLAGSPSYSYGSNNSSAAHGAGSSSTSSGPGLSRPSTLGSRRGSHHVRSRSMPHAITSPELLRSLLTPNEQEAAQGAGEGVHGEALLVCTSGSSSGERSGSRSRSPSPVPGQFGRSLSRGSSRPMTPGRREVAVGDGSALL